MTSNSYPLLSRNCSCCCCGDRCCVASYMVTDFVELFSVAVELPLLSHAIILSLSCSSLELIPLNVTTTQEHLGSDKVTSRITITLYSEVKSRFMTSSTGAEMSDHCGLWRMMVVERETSIPSALVT